jgi:hypothetical protein
VIGLVISASSICSTLSRVRCGSIWGASIGLCSTPCKLRARGRKSSWSPLPNVPIRVP